jgi:hypothetical protein
MDRPLALVGVRGVGKTALLRELADRATRAAGAPRLRLEVTPGTPFLPTLVARAQMLAQLIEDQPPARRFVLSETVLKAGFGGVGAEVHLARTSAPPDLACDEDPCRILNVSVARAAGASRTESSGKSLKGAARGFAREDEVLE